MLFTFVNYLPGSFRNFSFILELLLLNIFIHFSRIWWFLNMHFLNSFLLFFFLPPLSPLFLSFPSSLPPFLLSLSDCHFCLGEITSPISPVSSQWPFLLHYRQQTNDKVTTSFTFLHMCIRICGLNHCGFWGTDERWVNLPSSVMIFFIPSFQFFFLHYHLFRLIALNCFH